MRRLRDAEALAQVRIPSERGQLAVAGISWIEFRKFWFNSFANWLDGRRAKIFSQSVGAIVSLLLFFVVVTEVFNQARNQAYRTLTLAALATQTIFEDPNDEVLRYQAILKTYLLPTPPPPPLNSNDELQGVVASLREEDVILTAEVQQGRRLDDYFRPAAERPFGPGETLNRNGAGWDIPERQPATENTSNVAVVYLSSITTTARL